jgi:hypothetical protein
MNVDMLVGFPPRQCTANHSELLSNILTSDAHVILRPNASVVPFRGWEECNDEVSTVLANNASKKKRNHQSITTNMHGYNPVIDVEADQESEEIQYSGMNTRHDEVIVLDSENGDSMSSSGAWDIYDSPLTNNIQSMPKQKEIERMI